MQMNCSQLELDVADNLGEAPRIGYRRAGDFECKRKLMKVMESVHFDPSQ